MVVEFSRFYVFFFFGILNHRGSAAFWLCKASLDWFLLSLGHD